MVANVKNCKSEFKVGDRVFIPKLQQSGEIFNIKQEDNPYCQGKFYQVILDNDCNYKQKSKNPSALFREWHLVPDSVKAVQLSLV